MMHDPPRRRSALLGEPPFQLGERGEQSHLDSQKLAERDEGAVGGHEDDTGLFARQLPRVWQDRQRTGQYWNADGFTTCEGVKQPLRVVHTEETVRRRERVAGAWREQEETQSWYWATTLTGRQRATRPRGFVSFTTTVVGWFLTQG
jgi:hypothetical protein